MSPTVTQLTDSFLAQLRADVRAGTTKPATVDWYRWQLVKLTGAAGEVLAEDLRPRHLVALTMTHHLARAIRRLFAWAVNEDFMSKNWFQKIRAPRCGRRTRVLTAAEVFRLYRSAAPSFRRFLFVLLNTAARPGEIRALRWTDVKLEERIISLSQFKAKDKRKDKLAARIIPLSNAVCRRLEKMRSGSTSEYVFTSARGGPLTSNAVRCLMRRARAKAGLLDGGERIVLYTLRHSAATKYLRDGVDLMMLSRILGHTNLEMTKRYLHPDEQDLVRAIDKAGH